jgi:hypothetical protein
VKAVPPRTPDGLAIGAWNGGPMRILRTFPNLAAAALDVPLSLAATGRAAVDAGAAGPNAAVQVSSTTRADAPIGAWGTTLGSVTVIT